MNPSERLLRLLADRFPASEIPALTAQYHAWRDTRPLAGLRVLDATPLFFNTCVKHAVLLAAGAELTAAYSDKIPYDRAAVELLRTCGVPDCFNAFNTKEKYDIILDCGGLHAGMETMYGAAELTRSGVYRYEHSGRNVFLTDSGRVKAIETCLGTGESCLRALKQFGYDDCKGKNVLIFGYGKVGRGLVMYFQDAGARVSAVDDPAVVPAILPDGLALIDRNDADAVRKAVTGAWCVVTATGRANALSPFADALAASHALLVNMGVEDEFGPPVPASRVLNGKAPLNFILEEPTRTRFIDPTMALDNAGALVLLHAEPDAGILLPDAALEREILRPVLAAGVISKAVERIGILS